MQVRQPVYELADLTIESRDIPHDRVVEDILNALAAWVRTAGSRS